MTLGQNIQTARRAKGLSQEALAERIGVSRQALGKWEKDTALPGLDNLQVLAAELGTGVDALLGAEQADPAAPAVTLDALRDLLAARDAEEKRRRRLWGCAGGAAVVILAGLLAAVAWQYERQIAALNQNYAAIQSSYAAQQAELSAQISELQDAVAVVMQIPQHLQVVGTGGVAAVQQLHQQGVVPGGLKVAVMRCPVSRSCVTAWIL